MAKKKSKSKMITLILLGVVVVGGGIAAYIASKRDQGISVTVEKVQRRSITQIVSAIGKIQPETEVKISSEASGEVIYLGAEDGDTVKSGQALVRIKPDLIETQLEQYEAASNSAKVSIDAVKAEVVRTEADLKRISELYKKEFASRDEFDRAQSAFEQAQSRYQSSLSEYTRALSALKQVKVQATRTLIFAPMNGVVTSRTVELGEKVLGTSQMQGTEMMRIADLSVMNALVDVDENDIVNVKNGDTARITVDAVPDHTITGVVIAIAHSAKVNKMGTQDEVTNFEVKIRIIDPEAKLRPGMSCNVDIETETHRDVLSVPLQAVTVRDSVANATPDVVQNGIRKTDDEKIKRVVKHPPSVVFLNDKLKAKMVKVETGLSDRGYIEIKSGLEEKTEIISGSFQAVSRDLKDGSLIKIDTIGKSKWKKN
ncbi:MAG: efflux RND transporter periplasmic adaptor subunit [Ignavibacteriae bacterium]|nr:efflux RND transporter periplasmic adaptor subunit [Ignavibacteriota bacterium]